MPTGLGYNWITLLFWLRLGNRPIFYCSVYFQFLVN
ncbi:hypothetical protein I3842_15G100500 [Carya illinoinensis]|uniref:Uncharacterized protein n=1 Tax=Carya illinoinensis TaxID=32201 RepID=A0A922AB31_CARIL|nr:hypothetical protein I3842_15G100500 [Carya illinoinensis]